MRDDSAASGPSPALRPTEADWLPDAVVAGFAGFTLLAHLTVLQGGSLAQLLTATLVAAAIGGVYRIRTERTAPTPLPMSKESTAPPTWLRCLLVAGALGAVAGFVQSGSLFVLWGGGAAVVGLGLAIELARDPDGADCAHGLPDGAPAPPSPRARACLVALGLGCAAATLAILRPDADDAFYVNIAVAAADDPGAPLLAFDTLHGVHGVPLALPVYRVHSFELLAGLVAFATPLRALDVLHLLFPAFAAFLAPYATARLLRLLLPGSWLVATTLALGFLLCVAETAHGHANFGFPRMQQGKAILLTVLLPLLMVYGVEFAAAPSVARWLRLAGAQIAAVGLSASALWLAPVVAFVSLASQLRGSTQGLGRLGLGLAASAYVLMLALALRAETLATFAAAAKPLAADSQTSLELADSALRAVLGWDAILPIGLFLAFGSFALATTGALRRLLLLSSAVFLLFWSPHWAYVVAHQITSAATYFRVFWLLPIPLMAAVAIGAPWAAWGATRMRPLVAALTLALAVLVYGWGPRVHTLLPGNYVTLAWPRWDLPADEGDAAREVARLAPAGSWVLAPEGVATWLPTFHHHPYPLVVREGYVPSLEAHLGGGELNRRLRLTNAAAGKIQLPHAERMLAQAIADYPLTVVCLAAEAAAWPAFQAALEASPLERVSKRGEYEIWALPGAADAAAR